MNSDPYTGTVANKCFRRGGTPRPQVRASAESRTSLAPPASW